MRPTVETGTDTASLTRRAYGAMKHSGRVPNGGDGVVEVAGVVGLADMEGVDAVGLKQLGEFHRLVDEQAATAELRVLGDDRQLVVDADVRRAFADGAHDRAGEARAVLEAAAVLVGALVDQRRTQRADQTVAVHLDGVRTGLRGAAGQCGDVAEDLLKAFAGDFIDVMLHVMVQFGPGTGHVAFGEEFSHGHRVVLRVEHLQAELAIEFVQRVGQGLERGDLIIVDELGRGGEIVCTGVTSPSTM